MREERNVMATTIEKAERTEKAPAVQPSDWSDPFGRWFTDWPMPR